MSQTGQKQFYFILFLQKLLLMFANAVCLKHTRSFLLLLLLLLLPCTVYELRSDVSEREVNIMFL